MASSGMQVRPFQQGDAESVVSLWFKCDLVRLVNDPWRDIARKLDDSPELFLIGTIDTELVATAMAGYDGHRGWINYLAVAPERQKSGLGAQMMAAAEMLLRARGCAKINLQVRATNTTAQGFYRQLGFTEDAVISFGKRLLHDC